MGESHNIVGTEHNPMPKIYEPRQEKTCFPYVKAKGQISCMVTVQLISAFVFATYVVYSLYCLNLKFQASSHLVWLYSLVFVGPCQNT